MAKVLAIVALVSVTWLTTNWTYQVFRKPTELFFPLSKTFSKTPRATWLEYASRFRAHSTPVITPPFLAALAQVETAGNPLALTYWRFHPTWNPFRWYRPASSAVGMYQLTDATFREMKRYCIHDHGVVEDGPWYDLDSCWFNALYLRALPSHAIELTSAYLDRSVADAIERARIRHATIQQKQNLAAIIHLCGAATGRAYASRGFHLLERQRCGSHLAQAFLAQLNAMKAGFARLERAEQLAD